MDISGHHGLAQAVIHLGHGIALPIWDRRTCEPLGGHSGPKRNEDPAMMSESEPAKQPRQRLDAALTPRPLRLLLIGRVKPGAEPALREIQARFPVEAAADAGIDAFGAFIGSGQYAVELEISASNVQQVLATFFNDPRIRDYRDSLEPVVEGLPGPDYRFGTAYRAHDDTHGSPAGQIGQSVYNTGNLHFAASMYRWRDGASPQTGQEPRGRASQESQP